MKEVFKHKGSFVKVQMLVMKDRYQERMNINPKNRKTSFCRGRVVLALLSLVLFLAAAVSVFAFSASAVYDYSRPGYSQNIYNESFTSCDLLDSVLLRAMSEEERNYLNDYGSFKLIYPKTVPSSYIDIDISANTVTLTARPYEYRLQDGTKIACIPKNAKVSGSTDACKSFSSPSPDGEYTLSFTELVITQELEFDVDYYISVKISPDDFNSVISKAYLDAEYFDYLERLAVYERELSEYNAYLGEKRIYDEACREYAEYLGELEDYEAAELLYNQYLEDVKKYNADYLLYLEAEKRKEDMAEEIAAYEEYLAAMDKVNYRLGLMDGLQIKVTPLERSLYNAIIGTAVDEVLANKDFLASNLVGGDEDALKAADRATNSLRNIFKLYYATEDPEKRYEIYKSNYVLISHHFSNLFSALDKLYLNDNVRNGVEMKGRTEKFEILLAQLYYASHAFSDTPVYKFGTTTPYDSSYRIPTKTGGKTPLEILGAPYYTDENRAAPAKGDVYPDFVPEPDFTPVEKPVEPEAVAEPMPPEEKAEPGEAPSPVAEPEAPAVISNPGTELKPEFEANSSPAGLLSAYREGKLSPRSDLMRTNELEITLDISIVKALNPESFTVTYFENGEEKNISVEAGTLAVVDYIPEKPETQKMSYAFDGWVDSDGKAVDLSAIRQDVIIYPYFKEIPKTVDITWIIDGAPYVSKTPYDVIPECPKLPEKEGTLSTYYTFEGWDTEPTSVTSAATYTAIFEKHYTVPELESDSAVSLSDTLLTVNAGDVKQLSISRLLSYAKGKYSLRFLLNGASFSLSYSELIALSDAGAFAVDFSFSDNIYSVSLTDENAEPLSLSFKMNAEISVDEIKSTHKLISCQNGEKSYIRFSASNQKIAFLFNTDREYRLISEYSVTPFAKEGVTLSLDKSTAALGEWVSVSYSIPHDCELLTLYYIGADGNRVEFDGDGFEMPNFAVSVGADFQRISYKIVFISEGVIISSKNYYLGESVRVPENPWKESDDEYSYNFVSWSPSVSEAKADVTYVAVFEKTPLPPKDTGLAITPGVMRLLVTGGLGVSIFVLGVLPSCIASLVFFVKRRRRK